MKQIYIVLTVIFFPFIIHAQTINDSVCMSANYQYDIFYSLYSGAKPSAPVNNWDLAFSTNAMDVGIRINAVNGVNLWAVPGIDTTGWAGVDSAGYQNWQELHNTDSSLFFGAFNINYTQSQFDFSWGVYDFNTHEVIGDSLFLIKVTDLQGNIFFKKIWIVKRADNADHDWIFRYANLDNTGDITVTIPTSAYSTKNFIYYSIINGNTVDREPASADWDILFTRYTTDIGGGNYYPVAGVYSNAGVEVADVRPVDVASTNSDAPYLNLYSLNLTEIGYDWKTYNMSNGIWEIEDSLVYFVRTNFGEVYKLVMTGFDGASTGNIFFNKTLIYTTGMNDPHAQQGQLAVYPNPVKGQMNILFDTPNNQMIQCRLTDMNGSKRFIGDFRTNKGINRYKISTFNLPKGMYVLEIISPGESKKQKIIIE